MSLLFSVFDGSYCTSGVGNPIAFAYQMVFVCWVKPNESAGYGELMASGVNGSINDRNSILIVASGAVGALSREAGGGQSAPLGGSTTPGVWYQVMGRFAASNHRRAFLDGTSVAFNLADRPTGAPNVFNVGARPDGGGSFNGLIAHPYVVYCADNDAWSTFLAQSQDTKPLDMVDVDLLHYWPDVMTDAVGGLDLTPVNSPEISDDEPELFLSSGQTSVFSSAVFQNKVFK